MAVVFKNNAKTTLASSLSSSATSVSVADGSVFPSLGSGEIFFCTLDDGTNNEIVKVTAVSSNTLTVVRAQESTTARSFASGDAAELRLTAGILSLFSQTGVAITDEIEAYLDANGLTFPDNIRAKFGGGNDFAIYHSGFDTYLDNATGHLVLRNLANDKDIVLQSDNGSGGTADYLRIDGSNTNIAVSKTMVFADSTKASFGAAEDLRVSHDGTNSFLANYTGNLYLQQNLDDGDIIFQSDNGAGGVQTYFFLDGSAEQVVFEKSARFTDNDKAIFGTGSDLEIYHDGSNSYIWEKGTGNLIVRGTEFRLQDSSGNQQLVTNSGAGVGLYHNASIKMETTSTGISVTGTADADAITSTGLVKLDYTNPTLTFRPDNSAHFNIKANESPARLELGHSVNKNLYLSNTGGATFNYNLNVAGNIDVNSDSGQLQFGADNDMQMFHNGANGEINVATGSFTIDSAAGITLDADGGQVDFKDNGTLKALIDFTGSNVEIQSRVTDGDLLFRGQDGSSFITALSLDMSNAGSALFNSSISLSGSSGQSLSMHSGDIVRHNTPNGYIELGPANTGHAHIQTDRSNFYFNKQIIVDEGIIQSYDEDLILRRAQSSSGQLQLTTEKFISSSATVGDNTFLLLGGFVADAPLEESRHFYFPGISTNHFAGANQRYTVTATKNGTAFTLNDVPFQAGSSHHGFSVATDDVVVITITNAGGLTYGAAIGIVFGHSNWRAKDVKIETSTDNGTNFTVRTNQTNQTRTTVYKYFSSGGTPTNAFRFTLTNFNTTQTRIQHIFAYNYNNSSQYFAELYKDNEIYANWEFQDNKTLKFGNGGDMTLHHDGTNSFIQNNVGALYIQNLLDDGDIVFQGDDGSGGLTPYFMLDGSQSNTNFQKDIIFADNKKALFGGSGDLQIYHDGSASYIDDTGTGQLILNTNGSQIALKFGSENMAVFGVNDAVKLYYDSSKKFETTSSGIDVTGQVEANSFSDGTISGITFIDEDSFSTNSATRVPTQQSVKAYVDAQVSGIVDSAPGTLNTLNELAAALGDDANFSTTVTNNIAGKLSLTGGTLSGNLAFSDDGEGISFYGGESIKKTSGTGIVVTALSTRSLDTLLQIDRGSGGTRYSVYHEGYHPEADTLTTPRTIAGTSFDGSANIDISYNNLTNKPTIPTNNNQLTNGASYITNATASLNANKITSGSLSTARLANTVPFGANGANGTENSFTTDGGQGANNITHSTFFRDNGQTFGALGVSVTHPTNSSYTLQIASSSYSTPNIQARVQNNGSWGSAVTLWSSGNDGSGSGLDADTLDGINSGSFLRSDTSDEITGTLTVDSGTSMGIKIEHDTFGQALELHREDNNNAASIKFSNNSGTSGILFAIHSQGDPYWRQGTGTTNYRMWHAGNDGSGSGLDADTLDGIGSGAFLRSDANDSASGLITLGNGVIITKASADQSTSQDSASIPSTSGAEIVKFQGGYTNGQYTTEFAKVDRSGNLPLYVRQSKGTANSFSNIARFGDHGQTNGSDVFAVFGGARVSGRVTADNLTLNSLSAQNSEATALMINGSNVVGTRELGSNAFNSTTIPTNNNQLTNGAGYTTYSSNQATNTNSTVTFNQVIATNNGNGTNFRVGDDAWLGDTNVANTIQITGVQDSTQGYLVFGSSDNTQLGRSGTGALTYGGNTMWHAGSDGSGSGLDADLLDGVHASSFLRSDATDSASGTLSLNGRVNIGDGLTRPAALNSDSAAHLKVGGSDVHLYVASLNETGGYKVAVQAARDSDFASFTLNLQSNGGALQRGGNTVWDAGNDGSGSGLDADTVDGIQGGSFLRSDATDTFGSQLSSANNVPIRFVAANATDTNDGKIGAGVFASGLNIVGAQTSSGTGRQVRIWGDVITDAGNKFWNAGNDGSGSGLDADTVDGIQASSFLRSNAADTATGQIFFDAGFDAHPIMLSGTVNMNNVDRSGFYNLYNINSGSTGYAGFPYGTMIAIGNDKGSQGFGLQIAHERTNTQFKVRGMNDTGSTWSSWATIWTSAIDGSGSGLDADLLDGVQGSSYLRSDANDTFTGTLTLNGQLDLSSTDTAARYIHMPRGGGITFYGDTSQHHGIFSRNNSNSSADDILITSYGAVYIDLDSNSNNSSGADFIIGRHNSTSQNLFSINGETAHSTLGYDGQNPNFKLIYDDNHGNGDGWDTVIQLGRLQDRHSGSGVFPTYQNVNGYGLYMQGNSDGCFFGMEEYNSSPNFRPVIAWGDDTTDSPFFIRYNNSAEFAFTYDGKFHADDDIIAFSTTTSDARYKDNVSTIENALDKVQKIRGVEFDWNATSKKGKHDIGFIAQEIEEVVPEIVSEQEMLVGDFENTEEKAKTVAYGQVTALLVEAVKEQQDQIEYLKSELIKLKENNNGSND